MKRSFRVAYGGLIVGLSIICMFFTGVFPFAEYALPALDGILLIALVFEFGFRAALIGYIAVSLLSLIITPNKEAAVLFVLFFGYYPIVKGKVETLKSVAVQWIVKELVFNVALVSSYLVLVYVLGMTEVMDDFSFMHGAIVLLWLRGNAVFVLYDIAVTRLVSFYVNRLKPRYFKRFQ